MNKQIDQRTTISPINPRGNIHDQFRHSTYDYINLTHLAKIQSVMPGNKINGMIQATKEAQKVFIKNLEKDLTKTEVTKDLMAAKSSTKFLHTLISKIDRERSAVYKEVETKKKFLEVETVAKGTTDLLILMDASQALIAHDVNFSKLIELGQQGDLDSLRAAYNLPILKMKYELNSTVNERLKALEDVLSKNILKEDYEVFEIEKKQLAALEEFGSSLVDKSVQLDRKVKEIESHIIDGPTDSHIADVLSGANKWGS